MLAHECLHSRTFPALDSFCDVVVLTMRIQQHVVHPIEVCIVECERLRAYEWNTGIACESLFDHRTVRLPHDQIVKPRIHIRIECLVTRFDVSLAEDPVAIREALTQRTAERSWSAALRDATRSQSLDQTAQIYGVEDVSRADLLDDITTCRMLDKQAFLRQDRQCLAYRCSRHPEALGERRFGDSLSRGQFSLENHLPDSNQGPRLLVVHVGGDAVFADRSVPLHGMPMRALQRNTLDPECNPPRWRAAMYPIGAKWDPIGVWDPVGAWDPLAAWIPLAPMSRWRLCPVGACVP
jgi:hypothetical protein